MWALEGAALPTPAPGWLKQGSSSRTAGLCCGAGHDSATGSPHPKQQTLCVSLPPPHPAGPGQCQALMVLSALLQSFFLIFSFHSPPLSTLAPPGFKVFK